LKKVLGVLKLNTMKDILNPKKRVQELPLAVEKERATTKKGSLASPGG